MLKVFLIILISMSACQNQPGAFIQTPNKEAPSVKAAQTATVEKSQDLRQDEPIKPIPLTIEVDPKKVLLGQKLFHDKRLSKDNSISCASCHDLAKGGTDLTPTSTGVDGKLGPINSPTVFNSGLNFVQFWDGRAKDLQEQADGPVNNPIEMASNWPQVIGKLSKDDEFTAEFKAVYPDGFSGKNITDAIAEFEKTLITPNSPFDKWLRGDDKALSKEALAGYELFKGYGCTTCHNGANVGGTSFQKFGLVKDYLSLKGHLTHEDMGRFNVTQKDEDKHKFKVPSLRTASITPPYFHDASAKTLEEAIVIMGRHQVGVELTPEEVKQIKIFIESLVGEYQGKNLLSKSPSS